MRHSVSGRACAAVLRDSAILMVHHLHDGRDYWTLPGGVIEPGESAEVASVRELFEETGLRGAPERRLYTRDYERRGGGRVHETCILVRVGDEQRAALGSDPEMAADAQILVGVAWRPLALLTEDPQVRRLVKGLTELAD